MKKLWGKFERRYSDMQRARYKKRTACWLMLFMMWALGMNLFTLLTLFWHWSWLNLTTGLIGTLLMFWLARFHYRKWREAVAREESDRYFKHLMDTDPAFRALIKDLESAEYRRRRWREN